jgi:hypothetical protein
MRHPTPLPYHSPAQRSDPELNLHHGRRRCYTKRKRQFPAILQWLVCRDTYQEEVVVPSVVNMQPPIWHCRYWFVQSVLRATVLTHATASEIYVKENY